MSFAIALANHENNRENFLGFDVPDLPCPKHKIHTGFFSRIPAETQTRSDCFGGFNEAEYKEPMILMIEPSKTLYKHLEAKGTLMSDDTGCEPDQNVERIKGQVLSRRRVI